MLTARLFGIFSLNDGPRTLTLPTDKARAVLAYLLVAAQPQTRSRLATLFWPDLPPRRGLHNLTNALIALRRIAAETDHELLIDTPTTIALNPAAISCDLQTAAGLYLRIGEHPHHAVELCSSCAAHGSQLLALAGEPFLLDLELPDCEEFTQWLQHQREVWYERSVELRRNQAVQLRRLGRYNDARTQLLTVLHAEPWREEIVRDVIALSAALGERTSALRQYQRGREALQRRFATEPEPATTALAEAISANRYQPPSVVLQRVPATQTPFYGRSRELAGIVELLCDRNVRLVSIVGSGGSGKTYLALTAASTAAPTFDTTIFVALNTSASADDAVLRIAGAIDLELTPQVPPLNQLQRRLREGSWLLVLDNLEQIPDIDQLLTVLLDTAAGLTLLATSRRPIGLQRERLIALQGFQLPPDDEPTAEDGPDDALSFIQRRAAALVPDHGLDATRSELLQLCRLTAGLPLALEMAVAQLRTHSADELLSALDRELSLLATSTPDVPERQRSIVAVFAQSWRSLRPELRTLLTALTTCLSPFDDAVAGAVAGLNTVRPQIDELHQLGLSLEAGPGRTDLHPLLRRSIEQLDTIDSEVLAAAQLRHMRYFLDLLEAEPLRRPDRRTVPFVTSHAATFSDVRAAWQLALQRRDVSALRDAHLGLQQFCMYIGWYALGCQMLCDAAEAVAELQPAAAADFLLRAALLALQGGKRPLVLDLVHRAEHLNADAVTRAHAATLSAAVKMEERDFVGSIADFEAALAITETLPADVLAFGTFGLSRSLVLSGRHADAESVAETCRSAARRAGDVRILALLEVTLAIAPAREGDNARAAPLFAAALASARELGLAHVLWVTVGNYAHTLAFSGGDHQQVRALLAELVALTESMHDEFRNALMIASTITVHLEIGDVDIADRYWREALRLARSLPHPSLEMLILESTSHLALHHGATDIAERALRMALGHPEAQPTLLALARERLGADAQPLTTDRDQLSQHVHRFIEDLISMQDPFA
jgi:DNA-binding SARP family transcriptional activator